MNRNNERHFLNVPQQHMSRSTFKRDQTILTTFDSGELIPFYVDEVLPNDTFRVNTSAIIRMTTPKYPVMDDSFIDIYYFYAPNRILWEHWKQFMGEVEGTPWMPEREYKVPTITIRQPTKIAPNAVYAEPVDDEDNPRTGSILDYMGVPTHILGEKNSTSTFEVNALPVRAYVMIWNEFFRDQNVENEATWIKSDTNVDYTDSKYSSMDDILTNAITGGRCLPVNKFHDYFTSCLPYPQRGPEVNIPMTGNANVIYENEDGSLENNQYWIGANKPNLSGDGTLQTWYVNSLDGWNRVNYLNKAGTAISGHLATDLSSVNAVTINELRQAIAVQHYYEALARGGSRYREQIRAIWGTEISDKTVQIPEYLGGGRYHVNMNQIVQTSAANTETNTPIGETGAMSVTPINESSFTKSFEEHGWIIGVMCVRHNRSYQQGLERMWSRRDRLDYYVPQFANLGEQPVKKKEIMLTGNTTDEETFGYQEAWADYRMKPNRISGKMRSNAEGTLDFWHYGDNYSTVPTLSQEWMSEGKTEIARTLIVQDEPQFFGGIQISNKTTRVMPLYSVPGLDKI